MWTETLLELVDRVMAKRGVVRDILQGESMNSDEENDTPMKQAFVDAFEVTTYLVVSVAFGALLGTGAYFLSR